MEFLAFVCVAMIVMVFGIRAFLAGLAFVVLVAGTGLAFLVGRLI